MAVGQKWVTPSDFWRLTPEEFWWMYEAHVPDAAIDKWADLYDMLG